MLLWFKGQSLKFATLPGPLLHSEKYRDLIDAADSIVDMQKCSEQVGEAEGVFFSVHEIDFLSQVKHSVATMETLCQKLQQTHFLKGSGGMQGPLTKKLVVTKYSTTGYYVDLLVKLMK